MLRRKLILFMNVHKEIYSAHEFIQVEFLCILMESRQMILLLGTIVFIINAAKRSDFVHDFIYIKLASYFNAATSNVFLPVHNQSKFL
jgi:hypothetical protein